MCIPFFPTQAHRRWRWGKKIINFHFQWPFFHIHTHTHSYRSIIIIILRLTTIFRLPPSTKVIYIKTSLISLSTPLCPYVYSQLCIDFRYAHQRDTHAILLQNHHFLCTTFYIKEKFCISFLLCTFFHADLFHWEHFGCNEQEWKKKHQTSTQHLTSGSFFSSQNIVCWFNFFSLSLACLLAWVAEFNIMAHCTRFEVMKKKKIPTSTETPGIYIALSMKSINFPFAPHSEVQIIT